MNARRTPSLDPLSSTLAATLADHTNDFVGVVDPSGRALFLNRSVRGVSPDDVEGKPLEDFLTPERASRIRAMLVEARTTDMPVIGEVRIDAVDGSERWFVEKCVPYRETDGSLRFLLVRTERTHLRRAEEELRASELRYRTLFESNPDPVVVVATATLQIVAANPAAVRLYGLRSEAPRDVTWVTLFHEDEREDIAASYASSPTGERRRTARQRRHDGAIVPVEIVDNPIVFAGIAARVAVVRDLTEREQLEAKLRHAQKMEAMGEFAGGIAHDFNNLLAVISGCALGVRDVVPAGTEESLDLDTLDDAVERGASLTKKLMLFCRRAVLSRVPVDLVRLLDDLRALLRRLAGAPVTLTVTHDVETAPILADRTEVEQLVSNLVLNAGQASSTRITLHTSVIQVDASFAARLPQARPGAYVRLVVTDDGVGMNEATLVRIFEPFFTTKSTGTGLGLAVVHGVVERHEGHLLAESWPGKGTSVAVYLPLSSAPSEPAKEAAGSRALRVLLADDDDALRRLTVRMLQRLGYQVVGARDGIEALQLFEATPDAFDYVVLDVRMPKLDGPRTFARMRALRPGLQGIFVSGYLGTAVTEDGAAEDVAQVHVLHKPFNLTQLGEALKRLRSLGGASND